MIVYDVVTKLLGTDYFLSITSLTWTLALHCFVQSGELFTVKENKHTHKNSFNALSCRSEYFKNSLILCLINRCNKIDINIWCSSFYHEFWSALSRLVKAIEKNIFNIYESVGTKFLVRMRSEFCHLPEQQFRSDYRNTSNRIWFCNVEAKTTTLYVVSIIWTSQPLWMVWKTLTVPFLQWVWITWLTFFLHGYDKLHEKMQLSEIYHKVHQKFRAISY